MRRMAWREDRTFYRNVCKLCNKSIITIHAPSGQFAIYCRECFRSDKWNSIDYGRDYDFSKPFFTQYRELMEAVPRPALTGRNLINSELTNACLGVKNCSFTFWSYYSENSQNCYALLLSKNVFNCYVVDNSDHAHESLHCNRLYKVSYGYFADNCLDSSFLYNCLGCSDCFGCVNLRKQKYCIFNERLSKEEYRERIKYWDLGSFIRVEEAKKKFKELYLSMPHRYAHIINSFGVTGDIVRDAKNCKACFTVLDGVENSKYIYTGGLNLKDSQDVSGGGDTSELLYEVMMGGQSSRCFLSAGATNSTDIWYSDWTNNSSKLFGCVSIKNRRHCILNKQYTEEDYERLIVRIKLHMDEMPYIDKKGRVYKFGEFFPTELSAYAFNDSFGFAWYPKTKAEALAEGWSWQNPPIRSYEITLQPENLEDHIKNVPDSILNEVIGCEHSSPSNGGCNENCTTAFRITREELTFYREMNIALPRLCPNCRNADRLRWRNGFALYHRSCMCEKTAHSSYGAHNGSNCQNKFETTFAPEKPEIVYCEECYKAEYL